MDIALDKVCELILRARAIDVKEGVTDPDSGSNAIDDGSADVLINSGDDLTECLEPGAQGLPQVRVGPGVGFEESGPELWRSSARISYSFPGAR